MQLNTVGCYLTMPYPLLFELGRVSLTKASTWQTKACAHSATRTEEPNSAKETLDVVAGIKQVHLHVYGTYRVHSLPTSACRWFARQRLRLISCLDYGEALCMRIPLKTILKLLVLQNVAARVVAGAQWCKSVGWLLQ